MVPSSDDQKVSDTLIQNLQQANRLIRSRAVILTFFLILMMGFSLSIKQEDQELQALNRGYDRLLRLFTPDSMKVILTRDSLKYLSDGNLIGPYMSVEVLYDQLKRDSFKNTQPLYVAVNELDTELREKKQEQQKATVSIGGFSTPIRPIMILAPILLLLLYHDFSIIMLYRRKLEQKMIERKIDIWKVGPETVGHYMLEFLPNRLKHIKVLWGIIQMVILFLPVLPAIYFCLYSVMQYQITGGVFIINLICCFLIFIDFLVVLDSENILGLRDVSMVFSGKRPSDATTKFWYRRNRMTTALPLVLGLFTWYSFHDILQGQRDALLICIVSSSLAGLLTSGFSILSGVVKNQTLRGYLSVYASGAFFAALFWFIIDLLSCFGSIHFSIIDPLGYAACSFAIMMVAGGVKAYYVVLASKEISDSNESLLN
jgi:hypothetical protein